MDATHARANAHMAAIVKPERQLSAAQVVAYLQGLKHVAFGTVNARGEPRVSPLDGHFVHGRFTLSTGRGSARWRNLERNPGMQRSPLHWRRRGRGSQRARRRAHA